MKSLLDNIEGQAYITYSDNRFVPIIKNCKEIMQLANERNISLYKKISDDGRKYPLLKIEKTCLIKI